MSKATLTRTLTGNIFIDLNMPINVFGKRSKNTENITDTSLFVQKPYLRSNSIEANFEEDIDLKNQFKIKLLPDLIISRKAASRKYVDNKSKDPSTSKNTAHIDMNDRIITNASFIQFNQLPQIDFHVTAKLYVDNAIDDSPLVERIKIMIPIIIT